MVRSPGEVGPPDFVPDDSEWQRRDLEELVDELLGRYEDMAAEYTVPLPLMYQKQAIDSVIRKYKDAGWSEVRVKRAGNVRSLVFRR